MLLVQALESTSPKVRRSALRALEELASRPPSPKNEVLELARAWYSHRYLGSQPPLVKDPETQQHASELLAQAASSLEDAGQLRGAVLLSAAAHGLAPTSNRLRKLAELLDECQLYGDEAKALEELLQAEVHPAGRRSFFLLLGRLFEERLGEYERAADLFAKASAEFPRDDVFLDGQSRCLEAARRFDELAQVIRRQLELEGADGKRALLHTRLASLLAKQPGREAEAMSHYREALRYSPLFEPPIQGLLMVAETTQAWPVVVEALEARLRVDARPRERAMVLARIGEVVARQLRDSARAQHYLERAIREYPRGLPARLLLLELLCEEKNFARAERFSTPPEQVDVHNLSPERLARLCQLRSQVAAERGRPYEALDCLALGLEVSPEPRVLLFELLRLLETSPPEGGPPEVLGRMARTWEREGRRKEAALAYRATGLLLMHQGDLAAAEQTLRASCSLAPEEVGGGEALATFFCRLRRFEEARALYERLVGGGGPERFRLLFSLARLLSDHLGSFVEAIQKLEEIPPDANEGAEAGLFAASLALEAGEVARAERALARLPSSLSLEQFKVRRTLELKVGQAHGLPAVDLQNLRLAAAVAGDPRALEEWFTAQSSTKANGELEALVAQVPAELRSQSLCAAGRILLGEDRLQEAQVLFQRADESSPRLVAEAFQGMAEASPGTTLRRIERRLSEDPFHEEGLELLCSLLVETGEAKRARGLFELSRLVREGHFAPLPVRPAAFWSSFEVEDALLAFVARLRKEAPEGFEPFEAALAAQCTELTLPPTVETTLEEVCRSGGVAVPVALAHPRLGKDPMVLYRPLAVVVSPALATVEMPPGALLFTLLRGVGALACGAGPLTYLAPYQLDVLAEALKSAATLPSGAKTDDDPVLRLGGALDVAADRARSTLSEASKLPGAMAAEPTFTRSLLDAETLRASLATTQDLVSALASLALLPPPVLAFRAARRRWLGALEKIPMARSAVTAALLDHLGRA